MNSLNPLPAGVYVAALTPMHDDFSCNCQELASHCNDMLNRGCMGIVLFGTTGEATSFSGEERVNTIKAVIELGVDPKRLVIGISFSAIDDAIKQASKAVEHHCSAVLMMPPFFYKDVDEEGVIAFYREVIQRVSSPELKIILYHIPRFSGVPITLTIIKTLREEFPTQVIGIKDSDGNFSFTQEVLRAFPGFKVFAGNELQISQAVQLGAEGGISGLANAYPELICSLYDYGKDHQKPDHIEKVKRIIETIAQYRRLPAIKAIVEKQKGLAWHVLRPPLIPLDERQVHALLEIINEIKSSS